MSEHEFLIGEAQSFWDRQNELFTRIKERGGFGEYVGSIEYFSELFKAQNRNVCCMDERTTAGTIRYAGSGILDQVRAASRLREAGAKGVYSHAGCGAAALAYNRLSEEAKMQFINPEAYAVWWAKEVATQAEIEYLGHLEVSPAFHIARVTYYDGTGIFDSSRADQLPSGFVISRRYLDEGYAKGDLKLSVDIAFGPHGFGANRFSNEAPFMLVVIGDPLDERYSLEQLTKEAKEVAMQFEGKVVVDGFVAPGVAQGEAALELQTAA